MIRTSYHTHNRFCDGAGEVGDYAEAAVTGGLEALGISCHAPLTFPDEAAMNADRLPAYCAEVTRLKDVYRARLRVHLSLEFDYIPERHAELWSIVAPHAFDYLVGSVHFVGQDDRGIPWPVDLSRSGFEDGLMRYYGGDIRRLVGAYYEQVRRLIGWGARLIAWTCRIPRHSDARARASGGQRRGSLPSPEELVVVLVERPCLRRSVDDRTAGLA